MQLKERPFMPRSVAEVIREALVDTPVVCLLGPRQSGKSTLANHLEPDRHYISLDDRNFLDLALADSQGFIDQLPDRVTIDEIQRAPQLTLAIKRSVDSKRKPGRFLLTGSANLLQLPRLADSLAGRMEFISLYPFTESEKEARPGRFLECYLAGTLENQFLGEVKPAPSSLPERLVCGGYPEAIHRSPSRARRWQRQYLRSIIERDIQDVAAVKSGDQVGRLLEHLSHRTAQLLNVSSIANGLNHTRSTVDNYLGVLERLFLIRRLSAWHSNRSKRLVKAPKIHICDSGLAAALSGLESNQWNEERTRFGHLLESFVVQQCIALASWTDDSLRFFHYRDKDQVEVDLVIERGSDLWGIEIKTAASVNSKDGKSLARLADVAGKKFRGGIVFYNGTITKAIDPERKIEAMPIARLWE